MLGSVLRQKQSSTADQTMELWILVGKERLSTTLPCILSCKVSEGIYHKPIDGNNMITLIRDSYEFVLPDVNVRITTATSLEKTRVQIKASTWTATCSAFVNINEFWDLGHPGGCSRPTTRGSSVFLPSRKDTITYAGPRHPSIVCAL